MLRKISVDQLRSAMEEAKGVDPRFLVNTPEEFAVTHGIRGFVRRDTEIGRRVIAMVKRNADNVGNAVGRMLLCAGVNLRSED